MPPVLDPKDIYSETHPDKMSATVRDFPSRLYVPNSLSNTVDVIEAIVSTLVEAVSLGKGAPGGIVAIGAADTSWHVHRCQFIIEVVIV